MRFRLVYCFVDDITCIFQSVQRSLFQSLARSSSEPISGDLVIFLLVAMETLCLMNLLVHVFDELACTCVWWTCLYMCLMEIVLIRVKIDKCEIKKYKVELKKTSTCGRSPTELSPMTNNIDWERVQGWTTLYGRLECVVYRGVYWR